MQEHELTGLDRIPVQTPWPDDAGPLITWPVVITRPQDCGAGDLARYNLGVYRAQVLGPEKKLTPGFVWMPLDIGNIHGIAALTSFITLTPGTVSTALSDDRRYLLIHVLHLTDADALIAEIKRRYEAPLMEIFP